MTKSRKKRLGFAPGRMSSVLLAAALFVATPAIAGCDDDDDDQQQAQVVNTYCVLEDGTIVPMEMCDDDGNYHDGSGGIFPYYYIMSTHHYAPGHRMTGSSWRQGRIRGNDPTARQNAGLPRTGRPPATINDRGSIGSGRTSTGRGSTGSSNHGGGGHSSGSHSGGG